MALLNFPPNPSTGDTYSIGSNTWVWTGTAWIKYTSSPQSPIAINTVTNATSTNTGALVVTGGAGISGDLYVGGEIVATKLTIEYTTVTTTLVQTDDVITTSNTTEATDTTTGALVVAGGAGIGGNLYVGGEIVAQKLTIEYTTVTTTLVVTDDIIQTLNETDSADTTTGALIVAGGAGIAKTLTLGYGLVLNPNGTITFGDGTVQSSRAFKFFTNADVALGLTTDDMLPGDWYFDDTTESIYVMVNYGDYNQLQDLTVRPTI